MKIMSFKWGYFIVISDFLFVWTTLYFRTPKDIHKISKKCFFFYLDLCSYIALQYMHFVELVICRIFFQIYILPSPTNHRWSSDDCHFIHFVDIANYNSRKENTRIDESEMEVHHDYSCFLAYWNSHFWPRFQTRVCIFLGIWQSVASSSYQTFNTSCDVSKPLAVSEQA